MTEPLSAGPTRALLRAALPDLAVTFAGDALNPAHVYVPWRHWRALSTDNMLVRGIRGVGKTLWWRALQEPAIREVVVAAAPRAGLDVVARVVPGFGADSDPAHFPDRDQIAPILARHDARLLWRAVVLWAVADPEDGLPPHPAWADRVDWVAHHPHEVSAALRAIDGRCDPRREVRLVLFDALDRAAGSWDARVRVLRGLMEVLVEIRELRAIRAKAFVRPDMLLDPNAMAFPDASKVLADAVDLRWESTDLYALLWQRLGNTPGAEPLRQACADRGLVWQQRGGLWRMHDALARDAELQRAIFHRIARPWMGANPRRGEVYRWIPNHLADAQGHVSPRSFLIALRRAAEAAAPLETWALDPRAVQQGVQEASKVRVAEINEDHPWIGIVQAALEGLRVPCAADELYERWTQRGVLDAIGELPDDRGTLPRHLADGHAGLLADLDQLGVVQRLGDGRWQVPDVYRVAFRMIRKGGVTPPSA
ncbi:MAG TPA: hypothetical protein PKA64_12925 [Myxococcota bacterium]|nr:hypothetical protein [Myxococcota bacterium]